MADDLCMHPAREGSDCVGPFLEDLTTTCGLWEPHPQKAPHPAAAARTLAATPRREGYYDARAGLR